MTLVFQGVSKWYGDTVALAEVSFEVTRDMGDKGKVTGLKTVRVEWKDGKMIEVAGSDVNLTKLKI